MWSSWSSWEAKGSGSWQGYHDGKAEAPSSWWSWAEARSDDAGDAQGSWQGYHDGKDEADVVDSSCWSWASERSDDAGDAQGSWKGWRESRPMDVDSVAKVRRSGKAKLQRRECAHGTPRDKELYKHRAEINLERLESNVSDVTKQKEVAAESFLARVVSICSHSRTRT